MTTQPKRNEAVYALRAPIRNLEKRAEDAEAEVERLSAKLTKLEGLERAARYAAAWFREYENLHAAKGTADGDRKALLNADRAERIEAALAYASEKE